MSFDKNNASLKADLRKRLLHQRQSLSPHILNTAASSASHVFLNSDFWQTQIHRIQHIAVYLAHQGELNLSPLIQAFWKQEKQLYLPIIRPNSKQLQFALYTPNTILKPNLFQILEPQESHYFPANQLDLVLLPLVGFDLQHHRLGMGGGYYDATFPNTQTSTHPILIGCGYAFQQLDNLLPLEPWDQKMGLILTPDKML